MARTVPEQLRNHRDILTVVLKELYCHEGDDVVVYVEPASQACCLAVTVIRRAAFHINELEGLSAEAYVDFVHKRMGGAKTEVVDDDSHPLSM